MTVVVILWILVNDSKRRLFTVCYDNMFVRKALAAIRGRFVCGESGRRGVCETRGVFLFFLSSSSSVSFAAMLFGAWFWDFVLGLPSCEFLESECWMEACYLRKPVVGSSPPPPRHSLPLHTHDTHMDDVALAGAGLAFVASIARIACMATYIHAFRA